MLNQNIKPILKKSINNSLQIHATVYTRRNATYYPLVLPKLMWLLKSPLDQNPTMIYHKFNGDFKSHINFGRIKGGQEDDM
jgi:hypothetical protein